MAGATMVYFMHTPTSTPLPPDHEELLDMECTQLIIAPPISACTFYDGASHAAEEYLRQRIVDIVKLNPWLVGKLSRRGHKNGKIHIHYEKELKSVNVDAIFKTTDDATLDENMDYYSEPKSYLSSSLVTQGYAVVDSWRDEPLFKVTLIRINPSRFATLVSISHLLVDGYSFYKIYGMLSCSDQAAALTLKRMQSFSKQVDQLMGINDLLRWLDSHCGMLAVLRTMLFGTKPKMLIQTISNAFIMKEKEKFIPTESAPFISTNDILTTWLFLNTKCDVGIIPVNMRLRIAELTESHAGNYEINLGYQPWDYASPSLIRSSLSNFRRTHADRPFPGLFKSCSSRLCAFSSLASFYVEATLPGCTQTYHIPYGHQIPMDDCFVLFRATKNTLKLLAVTRNIDEGTLRTLQG